MYYVAAQRGRTDVESSVQDVLLPPAQQRALHTQQQQQQQQPYQQTSPLSQQVAVAAPPPPMQRASSLGRTRQPGAAGGVAGGAEAGVMREWSSPEETSAGVDDEELEHEHGELMESILEDEEEIIALHRQQIEEAMEIVRRHVCVCVHACMDE